MCLTYMNIFCHEDQIIIPLKHNRRQQYPNIVTHLIYNPVQATIFNSQYLQSPFKRAYLEKLKVSQVNDNFLIFYEILKFITAFTTAVPYPVSNPFHTHHPIVLR